MRLTFVLVLLASVSALGLDTTHRGNRVGILLTPARYEGTDERMASAIRKYLREELQKSGFDAFDTKTTYDDLSRNVDSAADYYVEIAASDAAADSHGGVGVGAGAVAVDVSLVVAHVAAEVRLYDGRSLELIRRFDLDHSKKGVAPTSIGIGVPGLIGWVSVPVMEIAQFKRAAHEVARDAASRIAEYKQAE